MTQEGGDNDGENEDQDENDANFGTGIFSNADQVDGMRTIVLELVLQCWCSRLSDTLFTSVIATIVVHTGEEDELTMYVTKGKLFADADKSQMWKERGKGTFKINVGRNTKSARLGKLIVCSCAARLHKYLVAWRLLSLNLLFWPWSYI